MRKFDIVHVRWDDSMSDDGAWKSVNDVLEWDEELQSTVESAGFLLYEDDNYIVIALSQVCLTEDAGFNETKVHGCLRIPKCSIKESAVLLNC